MANITNVREFVINALKQYHNQQLTVEARVVNEIVDGKLADYVEKETGKGLSEANFTADEKTKLAGIESGAQVNVQSDWNAASGDAQILNKPDLSVYPTSAEWDSTNHKIIFKNGANVITGFEVNGADFIKDGMLTDVKIQKGTGDNSDKDVLFFDFNTDAGNTDIEIPLADLFDPTNYYNKTEVNGLLDDKVDKVAGKQLSTEDYTTAEKTKLSSIAADAQVNVIESVKVNNTALTPDANKAVNITVPTKTSDLTNDSDFVADANYVHTDNNYTTDEKNKLSGIQAGAQVNTIETIKVNNAALTPDANKAINITVPEVPEIEFNGSKSADADDYTYVANGFSASDHEITVSYTGVLKSHQDISGKEDTSNKKTSLSVAANISDTYYPTTSAVTTYIGSIAELSTEELNTIFGITA